MLTIVIPAYNEEERLKRCLIPTINFLNNNKIDSEIIIVCDGCTDNTYTVAQIFHADFNNLKILKYSPNKGKGFAVKTGMMEAKGNLRMFMDADYSVPIEALPQFIEAHIEGFDIIIGSRGHSDSIIEKHQKYFRELAGKLFGKLQKIILDFPFYDTQCGFKLFTKEAAEFIFPQIKYNCSYFDAELIYIAFNAGMKIKELPVKWTHDGVTRMPIGPLRIIDLVKKLFLIKKYHKQIPVFK
ncbi:MAG TPA: dolichyl-phosphate beta-glucosyltransferase [Ignavibacteria bacterium]|nr:dolichyl-phosphate beta-glucosyltransferase [Ignavibacteria bacterium]